MSAKFSRSDAEWRALLTPLQYNVTRRRGTERAFTGEYREHQASGSYACICCGNALFGSADKLADGSGWPSFRRPLGPEAVRLEADNAWMTPATEALCAHCDAHLGHAIDDEGTRRFCINSAALRFQPAAC
jgi:peptide-methionine (R)-S-oxide reductase